MVDQLRGKQHLRHDLKTGIRKLVKLARYLHVFDAIGYTMAKHRSTLMAVIVYTLVAMPTSTR